MLLRMKVKGGWPEERRMCPYSIAEYWIYRDEVSQMNDIIFKGEKIIIPTSLYA